MLPRQQPETEPEQVHTESTGENIASLNDAYETPKKKAEQSIKTFDFLGKMTSQPTKQGMAKGDYMRMLREKRMSKFEAKQCQAQMIVRNRETNQVTCEKSLRG